LPALEVSFLVIANGGWTKAKICDKARFENRIIRVNPHLSANHNGVSGRIVSLRQIRCGKMRI
jgi:hypothetical protein